MVGYFVKSQSLKSIDFYIPSNNNQLVTAHKFIIF